MASTTALYTGLSGMTANARRLDVIGNNIANANTTAFKSSRMLFETQFYRTIRDGVEPHDEFGGSNPYQIGLGVQIAGTQKDFTTGSISATGDPRDLAIQGTGFFIVDHGGSTAYTRAGAFRQDANGDLTNIEGDKLLGYGVDQNFNIVQGALAPLNIPLGSLKIAQATKNANFEGNLKADGTVATTGSSITLGGSPTAGLTLIPGATVPPTAPNVLEAGSLLREIADPQALTAPLFVSGQIIEISGAQRGTATISPPPRFTIGAGSTVQDLMTFLNGALEINTAAGPNPNAANPGVALDPLTGKITITGNTGTTNDLALATNDVRLLDSSGQFLRNPLDSNKTAAANGESVKTTLVVYDSLGAPVSVNVRMTLESRGTSGTAWRYAVDPSVHSTTQMNIATGVLNFDTNGQLSSNPTVPISIDRTGSGASSPLAVDLHFTSSTGTVTALAGVNSKIDSNFQDGAEAQTLLGFGVNEEGIVVGSFSKGATRQLGQVALATFRNQEGLVDAGSNLYTVGSNSGLPVVTTAGQSGTGNIVGGALELSNVDLGQEFIDMITTSTGYSASSRVIRTADELLQQLLVLGR